MGRPKKTQEIIVEQLGSTFGKLNKNDLIPVKGTYGLVDFISILRNWAIVNVALLIGFKDIFINYAETNIFNLTEFKKLIILSITSLIGFIIKRYFIGVDIKK